ncbi:hypothetical protein D0C36_12975 [Mucilaginibacter conchicola]|uniref:Uncharacterized protein n=1 Tax=Mucilaginibacter conchicola TaxID=2303333 RepID=A0A372NUH4_9SPHI|nr:hypothetical protein [Mucilaginibacter conchicola]RFZ92339.1 hypothetical protein D0C36_12975 [Mucilaginibacter conchicola]
MTRVLYSALITQIFLLSYSLSFGQVHKPDSVKIECEGFDTESFTDVSCDAFDYSFRDSKKVKRIRDKANLSLFNAQRGNFKKTKSNSIDVRGKITYHFGKTNEKYCFDVFGKFYRNGEFYYNKKLLIAIADNIYSKHPAYLDTLRSHE